MDFVFTQGRLGVRKLYVGTAHNTVKPLVTEDNGLTKNFRREGLPLLLSLGPAHFKYIGKISIKFKFKRKFGGRATKVFSVANAHGKHRSRAALPGRYE